MYAVAHQLALLVVDGERHGHYAGGAAGLQLAHYQHRIERVPGIDGLQEARRLFEEAYQRFADEMGKDAGAGRALDRHLQAMRQQVTMALGAAILTVIVDRVVVAAGELKSGEQRLGLRARVDVEALADYQVLEPMDRPEAMLHRIE